MAAKPTVAEARWAITAGGTPAANVVTPNSGQRDTGWTPNQIAVSSFINKLALESFRWFQYLSDGQLDGDHSINGSLELLGAFSTLDVPSTATVGQLVSTGDVETGGLYVRPARRRQHPATMGQQVTGTGGTWNAAEWISGATSDVFVIPLVLNFGERITLIEASVDPASTGTITVDLLEMNETTGISVSQGSATSSGAARQTLSFAPTGGPLPVNTAAIKSYGLQYTFTTATGHRVRSAWVSTDVV
jgi:hypothetical protein